MKFISKALKNILSIKKTKSFFLLSLIVFFTSLSTPVFSEKYDFSLNIVLFGKKGCIECEKGNIFLRDYVKNNYFNPKGYTTEGNWGFLNGGVISGDLYFLYCGLDEPYFTKEKNYCRKVFSTFTKNIGTPVSLPFTIIGNNYVEGFSDSGKEKKELLYLIHSSEATFPDHSIYIENIGNKDTSFKYTLREFIKENAYSFSFILFGLIDGLNFYGIISTLVFAFLFFKILDRKYFFGIAVLFLFIKIIMQYLIINNFIHIRDIISPNRIFTGFIFFVGFIISLYFIYNTRYLRSVINFKDFEKKINKKYIPKLSFILYFVSIIFIYSISVSVFYSKIGDFGFFIKTLNINNYSFVGDQFWTIIYILFNMFYDFIIFYFLGKNISNNKSFKFFYLFLSLLLIILSCMFLLFLRSDFLIF